MKKKIKKKKEFIKQFKTAYRSIEKPEKYIVTVLFPFIALGVLFFHTPVILSLFSLPSGGNPLLFQLGAVIPIVIGLLYPYIVWKNKEVDINENMHFFITHLRVLSISNLGLKDILRLLGGKKIYKSLGEEIRKIGVLSSSWRTSIENSLLFVAERTPSKILKDFLDRFAQSLSSGVIHRDFVEQEQEGIMEEYKTMYESSIETITILNEIYVALLTSIVFLMVFAIVTPMISGGETISYVYGTCFIFIASEVCLLYFVNSFLPKDNIWHNCRKKSKMEKKIITVFYLVLLASISIAFFFFISIHLLGFVQGIPYEIQVAISLTPLVVPGVMVYLEEERISRREKNFIDFLPSLGSIAAMRGGKITDSVSYLSEGDFGILSESVTSLSKRLKTRINDTVAWEWFGVETNSNLVQRFSDIFRESTVAAANPHKSANMITENLRRIKHLRFKKHTILKTTNGLFYGVTLGVALTIYVALVITRHMNRMTAGINDPFQSLGVNFLVLQPLPEEIESNVFVVIFFILVIHCFIIAFTMKILKGGHRLITLLHFVPLVWIVTVTATVTDFALTKFLIP
jgi:flagellar protein FlaJ